MTLIQSLLEKDEEWELIARAQTGDRAARDELVLCNQGLVHKVAIGYMRSGMAWLHIETDDLVQWGNEGLLEAIARFDLESGYRFTTYAWWWIRSIMRRYLLRHGGQYSDRMHTLEDHATIRRKRNALAQELMREPTPAEVQAASGKRLQTVKDVMSMKTILSLDFDDEDDESVALNERIPAADCDVADVALNHAQCAGIRAALDDLPPRQRLVLTMRFGFDGGNGMTLREVGDRLGVSRERARQIEKKALQSVKKILPKSFYTQEI
jgi:RNA polymerase sigma factor (sigma-70 family)